MKKISVSLIAVTLLFVLASCMENMGNEASSSTINTPADTSSATTASDSQNTESIHTPQTALDIMNRIWERYSEDNRFFAAGGDHTEAHATNGAPGIFDIDGEIGESMDSRLGFPTESRTMLLDAASLQFLMNANTFTSGAYHLKAEADILDISSKLQNNIQKRNWVCGMPERLIVVSIDEFLVSAFGHDDFIEPFKTHLFEAFPNAIDRFDEAVSFGEE